MRNKDMRYNLAELPAWEPVPKGFHEQEEQRGEKAQGVPKGTLYWSGAGALATPPAIGARVFVNMNGFGMGTVRGYFVEFGWLGVYVEVDNPPAWYVKQRAQDTPRPANPNQWPMIYGSELLAEKPVPVEVQ